MINILNRYTAASKSADLTRLPKIYLDFNSASDQYVLDSNQIICPD